ncbi:MAG: hypothetical protein ACI4LK_04540 [Lentihominibacter sp.]
MTESIERQYAPYAVSRLRPKGACTITKKANARNVEAESCTKLQEEAGRI